jgi:hypothetical protein
MIAKRRIGNYWEVTEHIIQEFLCQYLPRLKKSTRIKSQYRQCPSQNSTQEPTEYKNTALSLHQSVESKLAILLCGRSVRLKMWSRCLHLGNGLSTRQHGAITRKITTRILQLYEHPKSHSVRPLEYPISYQE